MAEQLTEKDALAAHARLELGLHPDELASPWHAAWASMVAFVVGGIVPLLAILLTREPSRCRSPHSPWSPPWS